MGKEIGMKMFASHVLDNIGHTVFTIKVYSDLPETL